jgi:hypothetical protein
MARKFRAPTSQTFKITENGKVLCTIRIRPTAIMWKEKSGKGPWYGFTPEEFGKRVKKYGREMEK